MLSQLLVNFLDECLPLSPRKYGYLYIIHIAYYFEIVDSFAFVIENNL